MFFFCRIFPYFFAFFFIKLEDRIIFFVWLCIKTMIKWIFTYLKFIIFFFSFFFRFAWLLLLCFLLYNKRCLQTLLCLFHTEDCDIKNKQEQWLNCAICWFEWNNVPFIQSLELYICRNLSFCKSAGHRNQLLTFFWLFWA